MPPDASGAAGTPPRVRARRHPGGWLSGIILLRGTGLVIAGDRLDRLRAWHTEACNRQAAAGPEHEAVRR